jgi:hypothetical protein
MINTDLFAEAWLQRFKALGGIVALSADGLAIWTRPAKGGGYEAGYGDGAARELEGLLHSIPGAIDALSRHVRAYPDRIENGVLIA